MIKYKLVYYLILVFSINSVLAQNSFEKFKDEFYKTLSYKKLSDTSKVDFSNLQNEKDEFRLKHHIRKYLSSYNYPEEHILLAKMFDEREDFLSYKMAIYILQWGVNKFFENHRLKLYLAFLYEKGSYKYHYNDFYKIGYRKNALNIYREMLKTDKSYFPAQYNIARIYLDSLNSYNGYGIVDHHSFFNDPEYNLEKEGDITGISLKLFLDDDQNKKFFPKLNKSFYTDVLAVLEQYKEYYITYFDLPNIICHLYYMTDQFQMGKNYSTWAFSKIDSKVKIKDLYLWQGIFNYELKHYNSANRSFSKAIEIMHKKEKEDYKVNSFNYSMTSRFGKRYLDKSINEKQKIISNYLIDSDPLYLTLYNEILVEHYYRIALANFRFTPKKVNSGKINSGWNSERGEIYLRYGKPDVIYDIRSDYGYNMEAWEYRNVKFVFLDINGNGEYEIPRADLIEKHIRDKSTRVSISFEELIHKIPEIYYSFRQRILSDKPLKIYQVKGKLNEMSLMTDILISYELNDLMPHCITGFIKEKSNIQLKLKNNYTLENLISKDLKKKKIQNTERFTVKPGSGNVIVEFLSLPDSGFYRVKTNAGINDFDKDSLCLSDLIYASDINLNKDNKSNFIRGEIGINPISDLRFKKSDSLYIYFEIYNLKIENKFSSYTKELIIEKESDKGLFNSIFGVLGLKSSSTINIESTHKSTRSDEQEFFKLDLNNLEEGIYTVKLVITDNYSEEKVIIENTFELKNN